MGNDIVYKYSICGLSFIKDGILCGNPLVVKHGNGHFTISFDDFPSYSAPSYPSGISQPTTFDYQRVDLPHRTVMEVHYQSSGGISTCFFLLETQLGTYFSSTCLVFPSKSVQKHGPQLLDVEVFTRRIEFRHMLLSLNKSVQTMIHPTNPFSKFNKIQIIQTSMSPKK